MPGNAWEEIKFAIAGIPAVLYFEEISLRDRFNERYKAFASEKSPEFEIFIKTSITPISPNFMAEVIFHYDSGGNQIIFDIPGFKGDIDLTERKAHLFTSTNSVVETTDYLLRVIFALIIFNRGGILFHGAGIIRNGETYLFYGHSGSGKSTVARLSPNDIVINDDLIVLMPKAGKWEVFGTPFWNPTQVKPVPASAPLKGLYRLVQDKKVFLEPIGTGQGLAELISNIPVIPDNPFLIVELFTRGRDLLDNVPSYLLHFLPDDSFWQVIQNNEENLN